MYYGIYRTKTYIAGDWTGDKDAIAQLYKWKNSNYWSLDFIDAHELTQANDGSLNCSIKASLKKRMDVSKKFVLVVGENTSSLRAGSCVYCNSYNGYSHYCARGYSVDYKSYVDYECQKAVEAGIEIVVLYNSTRVNRNKCPAEVRERGTHVPMIMIKNGEYYWDYQTVKKALEG